MVWVPVICPSGNGCARVGAFCFLQHCASLIQSPRCAASSMVCVWQMCDVEISKKYVGVDKLVLVDTCR